MIVPPYLLVYKKPSGLSVAHPLSKMFIGGVQFPSIRNKRSIVQLTFHKVRAKNACLYPIDVTKWKVPETISWSQEVLRSRAEVSGPMINLLSVL